MQFSSVLFAFAAVSGAYAASQTVTVGDGGSLAFSPSSITAQAGDTVVFEFRAKNHSVTQSTFANPCSPLPGGSNSGFQAVTTTSPPFPQWSFTIQNTSAPFWFYCAQTVPAVHCHSGMVFAINPTPEKSFGAFQAAANGSASALPGTIVSASPAASTGQAGDSGTPGAVPGGPAALPSGAPVVSSGGSTAIPSSAPGSPAVNPGVSGSPATPSGAQSSDSSNTATSSDGSAASPAPSNNGALHMGASASGILALGGLVAGLMF